MKTWLDLSFSDFDQDPRLFGKLNDFVDITLANDGNIKLQSKLRDFISRKVHCYTSFLLIFLDVL
jgi:hypothetical protein